MRSRKRQKPELGIVQKKDACLVIIDVQERFRDALPEFGRTTDNIRRLAQAFRLLGVPVIVTEQNPEKLGVTVAEISDALGNFRPVAKMHFSCCGEKAFMGEIRKTRAKDIILCGLETHVCVLKTALDLMNSGHRVHVVCDAVSSRKAKDTEVALRRLVHSGAFLATTESIIFQLIEKAGTEEFKQIFQLIK